MKRHLFFIESFFCHMFFRTRAKLEGSYRTFCSLWTSSTECKIKTHLDGILFLDTTTQDLAESTATEEPTTTAYSGPGAQLYGGTSSSEV
jgi:hypothetical protein